MPYKRVRSTKKSTTPYARRAKRARSSGRTGYANIVRNRTTPLASRVNRLFSMIETKEASRKGNVNTALPHNNIYVLVDSSLLPANSVPLNPFYTVNGNDDVMQTGGARLGDNMTVKGLMIKGFLENALNRPKVHFRIMLLRGAKGETFNRDTIFKGDSPNKMIDQVNTERFTIVAQKIFNISASNVAASTVDISGTGQPSTNTAFPRGGVGTKVFKLWVPGYKFGRGGVIQFENTSQQVKFYDYRVVILAYDWYGTPQDTNNVGIINDMYTKLYFKDA